MTTTDDPVIVEQAFNASVETLWTAITDAEQMRQWYFDTITEFDPTVGFSTRFNVHHEGVDYLHIWTITEAVPNVRLSYSWELEGYTGKSRVIWELSATPSGSTLKLTSADYESFPQDNPAFTRESSQAGWDYLIHDSLKNFLDSDAKQ